MTWKPSAWLTLCQVKPLFTMMVQALNMMTSSNGNIVRVTGLLYGESSVTGEFCAQRPVTRSFDPCLKQQLIKQWEHRWFETASCSLWRQCNEVPVNVPPATHAAWINGLLSIEIFPRDSTCLLMGQLEISNFANTLSWNRVFGFS